MLNDYAHKAAMDYRAYVDFADVDFEDLKSAALLAAVIAEPRYSPCKGSRASFFWRVCHTAVTRYVQSHGSTVFVPRRHAKNYRSVGIEERAEPSYEEDFDSFLDLDIVLGQLSEREQIVLLDTYRGDSNVEVGARLGVTSERVRQIKNKAMEKCQQFVQQ